MSPRTEPCFLTLNHLATWFTVISRIKIEGIADSVYKDALVEFEENFSCRCFYLLSGAASSKAADWECVIGNEDCSQPKVHTLITLHPRVHSFTMHFGIGF
jgi:hypothetical protein